MNKGFKYEKDIYDLLKRNNFIAQGFDDSCIAGSSNIHPDLVININGKDINTEIKLNSKAQAGGTSARYQNGVFSLVKDISGVNKEDIYDLLEVKKNDIENMLEFHNSSSIPFTTTKDLWTKSVLNGLLSRINCHIDCDSSFIENHYVNKKIYYIHIGGKGLYYMNEDIASLGVPRFTGKTKLEIRLTRNGSKINSKGIRTCSASLRIQSRILEINNSPYSLENIDSLKMISH
jgi:hypothetical protein